MVKPDAVLQRIESTKPLPRDSGIPVMNRGNKPHEDVSSRVNGVFIPLSVTYWKHASVPIHDGLDVQVCGKELAYVAAKER